MPAGVLARVSGCSMARSRSPVCAHIHGKETKNLRTSHGVFCHRQSSGAQLVPAAFTGCAPRKLLLLSLYGHTVVPRLKTVESHVIVPTSTPANVARAPKRRSTSTPFPVMADGFYGMEMNVRTRRRPPAPRCLYLTVNPPTSSAVPSKPKSRPTTLFSITNATHRG